MDLSGAAAPTRAPGPLPPTGTGTGQPPLTVQAPAQAEPDTQAQQEGSQQQLADTAASESKANAASTARGGGVAGWFDQDLRQRMVQVQKEEREPKRHRANPKGTVIKSFCKNPACGKQLTNGRANTCHHCGYDLAAHRREAQLDKLLRAGPMAPAQVRSTLKEAAQEVHVRSGGAAVVLTLVYQQPLQQQQVAQQAAASGGQEDEGGAEGSAAGAAAAPAPAPAAATAAAPVGGSVQTIAFGKPAADLLQQQPLRDLVHAFEAACAQHYRPHVSFGGANEEATAPAQQPAQPSQPSQGGGATPGMAPVPRAAPAALQAGTSLAAGLGPPGLGLQQQLPHPQPGAVLQQAAAVQAAHTQHVGTVPHALAAAAAGWFHALPGVAPLAALHAAAQGATPSGPHQPPAAWPMGLLALGARLGALPGAPASTSPPAAAAAAAGAGAGAGGAAAAAAASSAQPYPLAAASTAAAAAPSLPPATLPSANPPAPPRREQNAAMGTSAVAKRRSPTPPPAVDLEGAIHAVLPAEVVAEAVERCRAARLRGDVLVRLPQTLQLTLLMQAGLPPGDAASVVVEVETQLRAAAVEPGAGHLDEQQAAAQPPHALAWPQLQAPPPMFLPSYVQGVGGSAREPAAAAAAGAWLQPLLPPCSTAVVGAAAAAPQVNTVQALQQQAGGIADVMLPGGSFASG